MMPHLGSLDFYFGNIFNLFPLTAVLYYLLPNLRWTVLLAASLAFYGYWKIDFLPLLLGMIAWIYFGRGEWKPFPPEAGERRRPGSWPADLYWPQLSLNTPA